MTPSYPDLRGHIPTIDRSELRQVIRDMAALCEAGTLEDCLTDAWERVHSEAQDRHHCSAGPFVDVVTVAHKAARLFKLPVEECEAVAEEALLRPRHRIIIEAIREYAADLDGEAGQARRLATGEDDHGADRRMSPIERANQRAVASRQQGRRRKA